MSHQDASIRRFAVALAAFAIALGSLIAAVSLRPATASASGSAVPRVMVCAGTPVTKPSKMAWCTSMCSPYMTNITWKSWTADGATGVGTLHTNDGVPNCAQGTWTSHPGSPVILGNAVEAPYCSESMQRETALLFTSTNLWGGATLPQMKC